MVYIETECDDDVCDAGLNWRGCSLDILTFHDIIAGTTGEQAVALLATNSKDKATELARAGSGRFPVCTDFHIRITRSTALLKVVLEGSFPEDG